MSRISLRRLRWKAAKSIHIMERVTHFFALSMTYAFLRARDQRQGSEFVGHANVCVVWRLATAPAILVTQRHNTILLPSTN